MNKHSRRRLWIDPAFQMRLLLRTGLYFFCYVIVVLNFGYVFERAWGILSPANAWHDDSYLAFLGRHQTLLITFVMVLPAILYDMLKFSHRVAGPLYRCRQIMEEMADGKAVQEFKPRKHDLMRELFQAFNNLIKQWNARVAGNSSRALKQANHLPFDEDHEHSETNRANKPQKVGAP